MPKPPISSRDVDIFWEKTFLGFCQVNFIVFSPYPCATNGAGIHGGCGIDNDYLFSGTSIENICF